MRVAALILLPLVALSVAVGTGCGDRVAAQTSSTFPSPLASLSSDRWTEVWSAKATPETGRGAKGAPFTTSGGRMIVRVAYPESASGGTFALHAESLPQPSASTNPTLAFGPVMHSSGDVLTSEYDFKPVSPGSYRLAYTTTQPCTITVYVEK
jgi:hypothetical protein